MLRNLKIITHQFNHELNITAIIATFYDKRKKITKELYEKLKQTFPDTTLSSIRISNKLTQSIAHQKTIFEYDPKGSGSIDYQELAKKVVKQ